MREDSRTPVESPRRTDELGLVTSLYTTGGTHVFPPRVLGDLKWVLEPSLGVFLGFLNTRKPIEISRWKITRNSTGNEFDRTGLSLCRG